MLPPVLILIQMYQTELVVLLLLLLVTKGCRACSHVGCGVLRCALFDDLALFVPALLLNELVSVVLVDATKATDESGLFVAAHSETPTGF